MDLYTIQKKDFNITKGDTAYLPFEIVDPDGNAVDITAEEINFSVRDKFTRQLVSDMSKTHGDGGADDNDGIYYDIDTNTPTRISSQITETNQFVIVLGYADTDVDPGVYTFDVELVRDSGVTKYTIIRGNLIVVDEVTPSV